MGNGKCHNEGNVNRHPKANVKDLYPWGGRRKIYLTETSLYKSAKKLLTFRIYSMFYEKLFTFHSPVRHFRPAAPDSREKSKT